MDHIDQHIENDKKILEDPTISPQMRRHTAEELKALETYKERHPEDSHDPTPLELYCDANPGAIQCRVYDD
jgi:hypothetical protein